MYELLYADSKKNKNFSLHNKYEKKMFKHKKLIIFRVKKERKFRMKKHFIENENGYNYINLYSRQ